MPTSKKDFVFGPRENLRGNGTTVDFTAANTWLKKKFGDRVKIIGTHNFEIDGVRHTWHHHQDGKNMIPVSYDIHDKSNARHMGRISMKPLKGFFGGPDVSS